MLKRLCPIIVAALCFLPNFAHAAKKSVNVLILPFEINAAEDLMYLQTDIPKALGRHLKPEGAMVLDFPVQFTPPVKDLDLSDEDARRVGMHSGADFVVWGSMTWLGRHFSLDARLLEVFGSKISSVYSSEGKGLENLPAKVQDLADDMVLVLFELAKIAEIRIQGNQRIEVDAIEKLIKTKAGDIYSAKNLSEDLKSVFSMGYFDDVLVESEEAPEGKIIFFKVKEKPTVRRVTVKGAGKTFDEEEIKENLTIKTGSILNIYIIQNNIQRIEELYKEKNFHNVKVTYKTTDKENNQADLEFIIDRGNKVLVKHISFTGNQAFDDKKLKKVMKTSEKTFLSFLTSSGELNKEDLNQDTGALEAFYHNNGFIRAKVGKPQVEFREDGIDVSFKIQEGPRYRVGKVDIAGDFIFPKEMLIKEIVLSGEEFYNRTVLRKDLIRLNDLYADEGYAHSDIAPRIDEDPEQLVVNITYMINKGQLVHFEEIIISGNTKTRDKVIRRQLEVYEQGQFSGAKLKRSIRNLYRLDYFKDIKVDTVKGSAEDKMVLKIDVEEKSTGQFSFGGGYSNTEGVFIMGSVSQRNLFGRGQILDLRGELGGTTTRFTLSFTEPWLFDIPLTAGARIFNWAKEYDAYDRDSRGGSIWFGYPIFKDMRINLTFSHDLAKLNITDPDATPKSIQDLVDIFGNSNIITNSIATTLRYDTRDRIFSPTEGSNHLLTVEYAGLGGDIGFTKYIGQLAHYFPLFWDFVFNPRVKAGYVYENSGFVLPDYEKFFLGGINSLRGYKEDEIQPQDSEGNKIGGDKMAFANFNLIHPIAPAAGLDGVIFYDIGAVVDSEALDPEQRDINGDTLRQSVGLEVRWNSPMGPIRLAYGWKIDPREGEDPGRFEFAMGAAF